MTARTCWGPAGSGSKCCSTICSKRLNSACVCVPSRLHPLRRQPARRACALQRGYGSRAQGHHVSCAPRSRLHPRHGWAGLAASSLGLSCHIPRGQWRAVRGCCCLRMLTVGVSAACGPTCILQQSHGHSPCWVGVLSTKFNTTAFSGIGELGPGETYPSTAVKWGHCPAGSPVSAS